MVAGAAPVSSEAPLRVCLVSRREPGATGTSRYVDRLEHGLRARGLDVVHLRTTPGGRFGRLVRAVGASIGLDGVTFLAAYPLRLRWPEADVYHLTVHTYASALPIRRPRGPMAVTVHDLGFQVEAAGRHPASLRQRVQAAAEGLALRGLRRAESVIAVSHWTRQTLVEQAGLPESRITVTTLGVDHARYQPRSIPADFRKRHRLSSDHRYLIYVGSDAPRKNLPIVWQALQLIRHQAPDVVLLKVGRGYDPAARALLIDLARQLNVDHAIRFFDDVAEAELPLFYNLAHALVMPSLYEGFGLPALEAMACGTPAVISDRGALAELADDASAVLVDPTDAQAVAAAVLRLLSDEAYARTLAERGMERSRRFTWESMVQHTINVYHRMRSADA